MPAVNHTILAWARKSAGLTLEEAAEKVGLQTARGISGADRLLALEGGEDAPTRQLLIRMSKQYRRPLVTFYMSAPPRAGNRGEDFRTLPEQQASPANVLVDALIRDVRARQGMLRSLLEDAGEARRLAFIGSTQQTESVASLARTISATIGVTAEQYQAAANPEEGFSAVRSGAESAGVFVLLMGNLGSHHTALDVKQFRGFALADPVAPLVVVNDQDAKTAWAFTLIHELAHLWLGATGVSGLYAESKLERYCNDVASELLLPRRQLASLKVDADMTFEETRDHIREFSASRNLSGTLVAYRLYRSDAISEDLWERLRAYFLRQWMLSREKARAAAREQEGGPSYYVVKRHRVGSALITLVRRTMAEGLLTPTKAGKLLGVKPMNVYELISQTSRGQ